MSSLRQGSGAATWYPFTSRESAQAAPILLDVQVSARSQDVRKLAISECSLSAQSIELVDAESRQVIVAFTGDANVLTAGRVAHLMWRSDDFIVCASYDITASPYRGTPLPLVDRVVKQLGNAINSLTIETIEGDITFTEGSIRFRGGYNTSLYVEDDTAAVVDVTAGQGLGRYNNCDSVANAVRSIGGAVPNSNGNITISADDCIRVQAELLPVDGGYQLVAGRIYLADDCSACCNCEEKASPWRLAKSLQETLIKLIDRYHTLREFYNNRVNEIASGSDCFTRPLLNMDLIADINGTMSIYVSLCNGTTSRLENVTIHLSPLWVINTLKRKYKDVDEDFFAIKKGIIEIPDDPQHFYSLYEALRESKHLNMEADCQRGYAYTKGGRDHIKRPYGIAVTTRVFNEGLYEIKNNPLTGAVSFNNDGGIEFSMDCLEPGDTRYFNAVVNFRGVDESTSSNDGFTGFNIKDVGLIAYSPTHPEINVVARMGNGGGIPCQDSIFEDDGGSDPGTVI